MFRTCALVLLLGPIAAFAEAPVCLPGTKALTDNGDLSQQMMDGLHRFVERKIDESAKARAKLWQRDFSSREAYEKSIAPNRERLRKIIGVVDSRVPVMMERFGDDDNPALVGENNAVRIYQVRWSVLEGVHGEGLLLEPKGKVIGHIVALPDADQTPEQIAGLAPGVEFPSQYARTLAEGGFRVVVPTLVSRSCDFSGNPKVAMTNQPHREWIYRQAYQMGRHVIGYEVQKVLAAVDWFKKMVDPTLPANARSRKVYDKEKWTGYDVVIDVSTDVLFEIDNRPYKATLDDAKAMVEFSKASLVKAQANYDIGLNVRKQDKTAISDQQIDQRLGARDEAKATVDKAKAALEQAQLNYDWCKVTAPITGRLNRHLVDTKILFKDGAEVKEGDVLFEIDNRPYKATLDDAKAMVEFSKASLVIRKKNVTSNW